MRVQPRHQLLEIRQAVADQSVGVGDWNWGGPDGRNSISDAEQLLCILGPATAIDPLALDDLDRATDDVLAAVRPLDQGPEIPLTLLRAVGEYLRTYTDEAGTPGFTGGGYLRAADDRELTPLRRIADRTTTAYAFEDLAKLLLDDATWGDR